MEVHNVLFEAGGLPDGNEITVYTNYTHIDGSTRTNEKVSFSSGSSGGIAVKEGTSLRYYFPNLITTGDDSYVAEKEDNPFYFTGGTSTITGAYSLCTNPVIEEHPVSQEVSCGEAATFTVSVSGTGSDQYVYKWQYKSSTSSSWVNIENSASTTLTLANPTVEMNGQYRAVISGCDTSASSFAATLTVDNSGPVIDDHPVSQEVSCGDSVMFSVSASGPKSETYVYKWQYKNENSLSWVNIEDAASPTLIIEDPSVEMNGQYRAVISGCDASVSSFPATLTVDTSGPVIDDHPVSQEVSCGDTVMFSVSASGPQSESYIYKWQYKSENSLSWVNIENAASPTLTIENPSVSMRGQYRAVISGCDASVSSFPATLTVDVTAPILSGVPDSETVNCKSVPAAPVVTASDDCDGSVSVVFHEESTQDPNESTEGHYNYVITRTWTAIDMAGNEASAKQEINIQDKTAPTLSASASNLTLEYGASGNNEALNKWLENNGGSFATDNCSEVIWSHNYTGISDNCGETGKAEVSFTAVDASGNESITTATYTLADTASPTLSSITAPVDPVRVGLDFTLSASYQDAHPVSAFWYFSSDGDFTDGDSEEFSFHGTVKNGEVTDVFNANDLVDLTNPKGTGVYSVKLTVIDECNNKSTTVHGFIVLFDPEGGFVTGGGWINSPEGAYKNDLSLTGKANFGFNARYKAGKNNTHEVDGKTNFQFKAGDLHFTSSSHDDMELVISGDFKATYTGLGTINGQGNYKFRLTVIDAEENNAYEKDLFRIKIEDANGGGVVYDNNIGNQDANADPSTAIEGGSIVIHKPKAKESNEDQMHVDNKANFLEPVMEVWESLSIVPNPVRTSSLIRFSLKLDTAVDLWVYDSSGREVGILYSGPVKAGQINEVLFDRSGLPSGSYVVRMASNGHNYQKQIIID